MVDMESGYQHVLEKSKKRFEILKAIYFDTDGDHDKLSDSREISLTTGISGDELVNALQYLENERLIECLSIIYVGADVPIRMLHRGVVEIEAALLKPSEPTEHFPAQVFNITNNAPVTGQQFGNQNTLNVTQKSNLIEAAADIRQLLTQLEQSYPSQTLPEKAVVVQEVIKHIEADLTLKERVVGVLKSVGVEAFKEAIDHPLVNVFMAGIEGWREGQ